MCTTMFIRSIVITSSYCWLTIDVILIVVWQARLSSSSVGEGGVDTMGSRFKMSDFLLIKNCVGFRFIVT